MHRYIDHTSSKKETSLQHRFNRLHVGARHRCNDVSAVEKGSKTFLAPVELMKHRCKPSVWPMVACQLQACQECATARLLKLLVTGWTNAISPDEPMPTQKIGQRLQMASSTWWPIYMASPRPFWICWSIENLNTHWRTPPSHLRA